MAEAALSKTQRKNAKKRAKEAGTWKKPEAPPKETGVNYELFEMLREKYVSQFYPHARVQAEEHIAFLARNNYVAGYATMDRLADNCYDKLRKIPQLSMHAILLTNAIHDTLDEYDEKHKATTAEAVAMAAAVELPHPTPPVTETAPTGVIKSKKVIRETATQSKQDEQKDAQSLQRQVYDVAGARHREKDTWAPSYEKAVGQVCNEYNLQVPIEQYQKSMCELGRAMLVKELLRKTVAIIKYKETMKKYKTMKK